MENNLKLARNVAVAIKWEHLMSGTEIHVTSIGGVVTLESDLPWNYQKEAATTAVRHLQGIKVFTNDIRIQPESQDEIEQEDIERALRRNSSLDDQDIQVYVNENNVTLNGLVNSYFQKDEAERIAWNAPGLAMVKNELFINFKD